MHVTFENDNDIIVYTLECVIAHARRTQRIFVAQCAWWLASIIGLEQEVVSHIDRLQGQADTKLPEQLPREVSATPRDLTENSRVDQVLDSAEQYLKESTRLRDISALKTSGTTTTGRINLTPISKKFLKKSERGFQRKRNPEDYSQIEGIDKGEISRRKAAGECLCCAWPSDRKGNHRVKDCCRQIKLDKGTAGFPKAKRYQRVDLQEIVESSDKDSSTSESSTNDSL